jgi:hypothetical protein
MTLRVAHTRLVSGSRLLLGCVLAAVAGYLLVGNSLLLAGLPRQLASSSDVQISSDRAWTLVPGVVHARDVSVRGKVDGRDVLVHATSAAVVVNPAAWVRTRHTDRLLEVPRVSAGVQSIRVEGIELTGDMTVEAAVGLHPLRVERGTLHLRNGAATSPSRNWVAYGLSGAVALEAPLAGEVFGPTATSRGTSTGMLWSARVVGGVYSLSSEGSPVREFQGPFELQLRRSDDRWHPGSGGELLLTSSRFDVGRMRAQATGVATLRELRGRLVLEMRHSRVRLESADPVPLASATADVSVGVLDALAPEGSGAEVSVVSTIPDARLLNSMGGSDAGPMFVNGAADVRGSAVLAHGRVHDWHTDLTYDGRFRLGTVDLSGPGRLAAYHVVSHADRSSAFDLSLPRVTVRTEQGSVTGSAFMLSARDIRTQSQSTKGLFSASVPRLGDVLQLTGTEGEGVAFASTLLQSAPGSLRGDFSRARSAIRLNILEARGAGARLTGSVYLRDGSTAAAFLVDAYGARFGVSRVADRTEAQLFADDAWLEARAAELDAP